MLNPSKKVLTNLSNFPCIFFWPLPQIDSNHGSKAYEKCFSAAKPYISQTKNFSNPKLAGQDSSSVSDAIGSYTPWDLDEWPDFEPKPAVASLQLNLSADPSVPEGFSAFSGYQQAQYCHFWVLSFPVEAIQLWRGGPSSVPFRLAFFYQL